MDSYELARKAGAFGADERIADLERQLAKAREETKRWMAAESEMRAACRGQRQRAARAEVQLKTVMEALRQFIAAVTPPWTTAHQKAALAAVEKPRQ